MLESFSAVDGWMIGSWLRLEGEGWAPLWSGWLVVERMGLPSSFEPAATAANNGAGRRQGAADNDEVTYCLRFRQEHSSLQLEGNCMRSDRQTTVYL